MGAHHTVDEVELPQNGRIVPWLEPDARINAALAQYQDQLEEWSSGPVVLTKLVRDVRGWADELWERFVPRHHAGVPILRPPLLFRFQRGPRCRLGHFHPGRNDLGLRYEVNINPRHVPERSEVHIAATVLHELLHAAEDVTGTAPRLVSRYHSAWLRRTAGEAGIPCTRYGREMPLLDPSPFMTWARERRLGSVPAGPPIHARTRQGIVAASVMPKRVAWTCSCPLTGYYPRGADVRRHCDVCGAPVRRKDQTS